MDVVINKCPARYVDAETLRYFEMHAHYKNGFLPLDGGIMTQPLLWMDTILLIESIVNRLNEKKQHAAQRKKRG